MYFDIGFRALIAVLSLCFTLCWVATASLRRYRRENDK